MEIDESTAGDITREAADISSLLIKWKCTYALVYSIAKKIHVRRLPRKD